MYFTWSVLIRNTFQLAALIKYSAPNSNKILFSFYFNISIKFIWKNLNRWIKTPYVSMNIFCHCRLEKFWSLHNKKPHLLFFSFLPCILYRMFLLGTFFGLSFLLRTVLLIRTNSISYILPLITQWVFKIEKCFLHHLTQKIFFYSKI